ncbi:MAG: hypothetical protein A2Y40_05190 [Candidatus Margulisbacteria bacterium GWF2_35_9]|nr:MAG: hypothetical protein A2Y40_05190 [Candidatus Margulisbacteria bacterium GWF2_35_9]
MEISIEHLNSVVILKPIGTNELCFDNLTSNLITAEIQNELEKGQLKYILDLSNVQYIYSYGISIVVDAHQTILARGGNFTLLNPNKTILALLKNLLSSVKIDIYFDKDKAVKDIS